MRIVLVLALVATWGMVGVIWTMQLVHYPLLGELSSFAPGTAASDHARRITWVVGPLMAVEGVAALALLVQRPATMSVASAWGAAVLLAVALGSTVLLQVPQHTKLAAGHDDAVVTALIAGNWIRTVAWTAKGVLLAAVVVTQP